jgi:single-strand DNA-binding protein
MATLNKIMLIGRLTDNPEPVRTLPNSGNRVVKFRIAVGRSKKDPQTGQWIPDPNPLYITCEAFTRDNFTSLVDTVSNYCKKGSQIYLEGSLRLDSWKDKTTGENRSMHKIVVDGIQLLDTKGGGGDMGDAPQRAATSSGGSRTSGNNNYDGGHSEEPPTGDDGIPF